MGRGPRPHQWSSHGKQDLLSWGGRTALREKDKTWGEGYPGTSFDLTMFGDVSRTVCLRLEGLISEPLVATDTTLGRPGVGTLDRLPVRPLRILRSPGCTPDNPLTHSLTHCKIKHFLYLVRGFTQKSWEYFETLSSSL